MPISQFELKYERVNTEALSVPVVIVAAGNSSRMKGIDKQLTELLGMPVLARTLRAFEQNSLISEIVVVTREDKIQSVYELAKKYSVTKLSSVELGGKSREESVKNGLIKLSGKYKKALVHDGARPLVSSAVISRVASFLSEEDCVVCGVKIKDTIKKINAEGVVEQTLNREELIAVQTPQGVNIESFLSFAKDKPLENFTDDAALLEAAGVRVKTVEGDMKNIKITTPEDMLLAEIYLGEEY